jgi:hypothetical protein
VRFLAKRFPSWRRALSALAFCAMSAVVIAYGQVAGSRGPRPKAVVDRIRFDLGTVFAGEQPTHTFVVRNEGDAPLTLVDKKRDVESANIGASNEGSALLRPVVAYARATLRASRETITMPSAGTPVEPVPT